MESLPVGMAIIDSKGANVKSNKMFEKVWGSPCPAARDINDYARFKAWWRDTGEQVGPEEWASAKALLKGETVVGQLMEIERFDGTRAFVMNSAAPIFDADGKIVGSAVAILDISDRVKAEEELHHAKEAAEAANVAKSQFLANISHELRTPMNAILGMIELSLSEAISPSVIEYLKTARESADILLELLSELLDFSRIEAGKIQLESVPFSLRHTLELTLKMLGMRAREKGLKLLCDLPDDVPHGLIGDPLRLRQVVVNLMGNAIKFTEKGQVAVRVVTESQTIEKACLRSWSKTRESAFRRKTKRAFSHRLRRRMRRQPAITAEQAWDWRFRPGWCK